MRMLRFRLAVTIIAGLAAALASAAETPGRVTFHHDVLPILAKNCQGCHRPGQIAPMSFLTYATTRPWAAQIKAVAISKKMPPSVSNPHYPVLTQDDGLTQDEIDILVKWVDSGAPEGAPARR
jgi:mono/diheme cytochrome c family protein